MPAAGYWSDGETSTLIDAWGPVHLRRRPRGLCLNDWRAAASAVNSYRAATGRRFNRSRVQCQTRVRTLKERYKKELPKQPPSGWPHLTRLQTFLASPADDDAPPGFPPRAPAPVNQEAVEEEEEEEEAVEEEEHQEEAVEEEAAAAGGGGGIGLAESWNVPRRPRNAAAGTGFCPAAVVMKLAEVYERVELARIGAEKVKVEMDHQEQEKEVPQAIFHAMKTEQ